MGRDQLAPVALFVFNRPDLSAQLFERVRAVKPQRLLVVADGPRASRPNEAELCQRARDIVTSPDWPCEVLTNFSPENLGCKRRLSSGLDWVFQQCSEAIILEDDCMPSPSFFSFCTQMLERYRDDTRIMHVSGDNYDSPAARPASYRFSRYTFSWGWASWSRAWKYYDVHTSVWPTARKERWLDAILDDRKEVRYWEAMLDDLHAGKIDTWDYQWLFACWCQNGLAILPNKNLVMNVGVGPDATHFKGGHRTVGVPAEDLSEIVHPAHVIRDRLADRQTFKDHINVRMSSGGAVATVRRKLALGRRLRALLPIQ